MAARGVSLGRGDAGGEDHRGVGPWASASAFGTLSGSDGFGGGSSSQRWGDRRGGNGWLGERRRENGRGMAEASPHQAGRVPARKLTLECEGFLGGSLKSYCRRAA